ncbi:D-tyrosyl-tRNA(Tyr) deacylase [Aestuariicella hydrocarbonica]|uniref:D-aminoacyl-tRNA deacylase n=1 Tax=Pseudomaricurvus hydrocarbonicus TaxID=1470433 RepID=A0A9E5MPJ8_9GAMM|nr:D-aminoacyl-tRNA deacylase [Aestuariicella hydrocarbonica]NHO68081.1 D-tyrosyl-tRNA(Tyr) deacylase [Aestuariicella hydrocarbonica]
MRGLIQRVSRASVAVDGDTVGEISRGILLLLGVERNDTEESLDKLLHKLLNYRIFPDAEGKMNLSVADIDGGILVVSQFTLAADTRKGLRPGFSTAATPVLAEELYDRFVEKLRTRHNSVATGIFAADMQVELLNDGPVTFLLET